MDASQQTRLWRILATSLTLGAAGLGAYYMLLHQPLQTSIEDLHGATSALQEEAAVEAQRELEPSPLPAARVEQSCKDFRDTANTFEQSMDAHGNLFAVQELARRAGLENYTVKALDEATVHSAAQHRISLALEGTGSATHRLLSNIEKHNKAGALATLTIERQPESKSDAERRQRRRKVDPAIYNTSGELHAYAISSPSSLATERCDALAP